MSHRTAETETRGLRPIAAKTRNSGWHGGFNPHVIVSAGRKFRTEVGQGHG
jgi:hypothetical protein